MRSFTERRMADIRHSMGGCVRDVGATATLTGGAPAFREPYNDCPSSKVKLDPVIAAEASQAR